MPPSRWPGTEQKNVYSPGLTSAVILETPPFLTTSPSSLTPSPSIAMLWSVDDLFCESISIEPAWASAGRTVGERAARVGGDGELAVLLLGDLVGALDAGGAELALVLAGLGDRAGDVRRDVLRVLAREQLAGHRRGGLPVSGSIWLLVGVEDLAVDDALEVLGPKPFGAPGRTPGRGSGPSTPFVPRALEGVAGAALGDEVRLALDEVVPVVLELAARTAPTSSAAAAAMTSPLPSALARDRTGSGGGQTVQAALAAATTVRATPSQE